MFCNVIISAYIKAVVDRRDNLKARTVATERRDD